MLGLHLKEEERNLFLSQVQQRRRLLGLHLRKEESDLFLKCLHLQSAEVQQRQELMEDQLLVRQCIVVGERKYLLRRGSCQLRGFF